MAQCQVHPPTLSIINIQIEHITSFNIFGIILYDNLKWEERFKQNFESNRHNKQIKYYIPSNVLLTLYNSLILSHVYYLITLWGYNNLNRILRIQKRQ